MFSAHVNQRSNFSLEVKDGFRPSPGGRHREASFLGRIRSSFRLKIKEKEPAHYTLVGVGDGLLVGRHEHGADGVRARRFTRSERDEGLASTRFGVDPKDTRRWPGGFARTQIGCDQEPATGPGQQTVLVL